MHTKDQHSKRVTTKPMIHNGQTLGHEKPLLRLTEPTTDWKGSRYIVKSGALNKHLLL